MLPQPAPEPTLSWRVHSTRPQTRPLPGANNITQPFQPHHIGTQSTNGQVTSANVVVPFTLPLSPFPSLHLSAPDTKVQTNTSRQAFARGRHIPPPASVIYARSSPLGRSRHPYQEFLVYVPVHFRCQYRVGPKSEPQRRE